MRLVYVLFFVFLQYFNVLAFDSISIHIYNPTIKHRIEIYRYQVKKADGFLFKTSGESFYKKFKAPIRCYAELGCLVEFSIYVKNKYFFGGRWIKISTIIEKGKELIIYYSEERKARYCYHYMWIDPDDLLHYKNCLIK